ncbi:hypothetical protein [Paenibacillus sp.]|jgi:hypothetical protein|uniref:hypothetical protein n=1 Tax=Paenibacillus sp. TaxID=58172 RepID=UPI0028262431|nr:hypothetical protein [Paenibacillus sp.]MDR0269094.1 hypothetical protein [Paenibacillus sp.]
MSNELSRVKTYNKSRKKNDKKKPPLHSSDGHQAESIRPRRERAKPAASLSRVRAKGKKSGRPTGTDNMQIISASTDSGQTFPSRAEKYSTGQEGAKGTEENLNSTPSRSEKYSARKNILSKYFTNSLFIIFLFLTVFLVYWGVKGAPPLEELW